MGSMHDKETFTEYLLMIGYSERRTNAVLDRLSEQKGNRRDFNLFRTFLETRKPDPHLYDL